MDVVERFWHGVDTHDWPSIASTLADDFVRVGMSDDESDTCRGKDEYLRFVSGVIGRFDRHALATRRVFYSEDRRIAVVEAIETIRPPGEPDLMMHFLNLLHLNERGLISKLDIYWKTPPRMPPAWIRADAVLERGARGVGTAERRTIPETLRRYAECVSAGDVDGIAALYAPDASIEIPVGGPVHRGIDAIRAFYAGHELAERLELAGRACVAGREAVVPLRARIRRDGRRYELDVIDVASFDAEGRLLSLRAFFDLEGARPLD
jgi:steroid delta-isomerase